MPVDVLYKKLSEWHASGRSFSWRNNEIFFRDFGTGPAMLMVHGFPTAGFDWVDIAETMSQHFRLIVPDLIDYGRSKNLTGKTFHIHDQASMLEDLLRQVSVSRVHVVAHDVGDTVCQELLARQNSGSLSFQIETLILMNGGILPAEHRPRNVQKLLLSPVGPLVASLMSKEKFMSALSAVFGAETRPDEVARDQIWNVSVGVNGKRSFARRIQYMRDRKEHEKRWVGALQKTELRMRMINGIDDPVSGGHACDAYEIQFPTLEIIRLSGIGHFPPIEAPALCTRHILEFHGLVTNESSTE